MYKFIENVDEYRFNEFVSNNQSNFMQISSWAKVKDNWDHFLCGVTNEHNELCATALILSRKLVLNKKLFYIPRGYVCDYTNLELLKFFTISLKKFGRRKGAIDIKIDPFVCFSEDNIQKIKKNKDIPTRGLFTKDVDKIVSNLKEVGFISGGDAKEIGAYFQPRYTMAISLKDMQGNQLEPETLRKSFPSNVRNYIGLYHEKRGVRFYSSKDINDISKFASILKLTADRQNISLRNEEYFKKIMKAYKDEVTLFFGEVDLDKYIEFLNNDIKENPDKLEFDNKQIELAHNLKEKYGNNPIGSASIVIEAVNNKGFKVAEFIYAGNNTEILPSVKIANGLMFKRLSYYIEQGYDYCDLGGIDGNLNDHLTEFKSKFYPQVLELVGEYDLPISKLWFKLFKMALKIRK